MDCRDRCNRAIKKDQQEVWQDISTSDLPEEVQGSEVQVIAEDHLVGVETVSDQEKIQKQHDERWFALQIYEKSLDGKQAARICAEMAGEVIVDIAKRIQKEIAPHGPSGYHYEGFSCTFKSFSAGIDCEIGDEKCHLKYIQLARELTLLIAGGMIVLENPEEEVFATSKENTENGHVAGLPEMDQTGAEPEQEAALTPVKTYDARILQQNLIDDTEEMLNQLGDYWRENQPAILTQYMMMLEAYTLLQEKYKRPNGWIPVTEQLPEQPGTYIVFYRRDNKLEHDSKWIYRRNIVDCGDHYFEVATRWYDGMIGDRAVWSGYAENVVAWQQLPGIYEAGMGDKDE